MLSTEILNEFIIESKTIIKMSTDVLEKVEGEMVQAQKLKDYGNYVDRIMGGAKSIAAMASPGHAVNLVSDYAALCKAVGYKASQINNNEQFYDICVALLQDATENLESLLDNLDKSPEELKAAISSTFLDRLRWVSNKFSSEYRASVGSSGTGGKSLEQNEIDNLMKKMGF